METHGLAGEFLGGIRGGGGVGREEHVDEMGVDDGWRVGEEGEETGVVAAREMEGGGEGVVVGASPGGGHCGQGGVAAGGGGKREGEGGLR